MSNDAIIDASTEPTKNPLHRFQVFGERRSGTNFVRALIRRNTEMQVVNSFGWKHGIPNYMVYPKDCLFVCVVREPMDWLTSFYHAPFEVADELVELPFSQFLRAPWESVFKARTKWGTNGYQDTFRGGRGETLQFDRHPIEGRQFRNVVELRNVKLQSHLSFVNRGVNAVVVRYEDARRDPAALIARLGEKFDINCRPGFREIDGRVGPLGKYAQRPKIAASDITNEDREFILSEIDKKQELRCGYNL